MSEFLKLFNQIHKSNFLDDSKLVSVLNVQMISYEQFIGVCGGIILNAIIYTFVLLFAIVRNTSGFYVVLVVSRIVSQMIFCGCYYVCLVSPEKKNEKSSYTKTGEHYETTYENGALKTKVVEDGEWDSDFDRDGGYIGVDFFFHEIMILITIVRVICGCFKRMAKSIKEKEFDIAYIVELRGEIVDKDFIRDYEAAKKQYYFQPNHLYDKAMNAYTISKNENDESKKNNELLEKQAKRFKQTSPKKYEEILSRRREIKTTVLFDYNGTKYSLDLTRPPISIKNVDTEEEQYMSIYNCDYYKSWIFG